MKHLIFRVAVFALLTACNASKQDEAANNRRSSAPMAHNTVVECVLYDGMSKTSSTLTTVGSGVEVQVMDTIDAHFVKARVTTDGKVLNGYMYRTCFAQ